MFLSMCNRSVLPGGTAGSRVSGLFPTNSTCAHLQRHGECDGFTLQGLTPRPDMLADANVGAISYMAWSLSSLDITSPSYPVMQMLTGMPSSLRLIDNTLILLKTLDRLPPRGAACSAR